jgi:acetolactate synthase-1/2/3 large subunit
VELPGHRCHGDPLVLAKAFYIAGSGRPGPVLIDITKNAQQQKFSYEGYTRCEHIRSYRPKPIVRKEYIAEAAKLINEAKKPFILFGQGVILGKAEKEFQAFVEKSGIPAAWTILGLSALSTRPPAECRHARHARQLWPQRPHQ